MPFSLEIYPLLRVKMDWGRGRSRLKLSVALGRSTRNRNFLIVGSASNHMGKKMGWDARKVGRAGKED